MISGIHIKHTRELEGDNEETEGDIVLMQELEANRQTKSEVFHSTLHRK